MKFSITVLVALLIVLSPSANGAEIDTIRVFDENVGFNEDEMMALLKQADLEKYGFTKHVQNSTETVKGGDLLKKTTIYYSATDDCDNVIFWERVLEERLPEKLKNLNLLLTTVNEAQKRTIGRKTKGCTFGLEIQLTRYVEQSSPNHMHLIRKRGVQAKLSSGKCCCCCTCCCCCKTASRVDISFDDLAT